MSWEYSENILVQNSAGNVLKDKLGWEVVYAYDKEKLGEDGTLGRKSYNEIVLVRYLRKALFDNNEWMTEEYADSAVRTLCAYIASSTLMQINEEKYSMLRDGIPVQFKNDKGVYENRKAFVFNFKEPEKNHFLAVKEMKIHGNSGCNIDARISEALFGFCGLCVRLLGFLVFENRNFFCFRNSLMIFK